MTHRPSSRNACLAALGLGKEMLTLGIAFWMDARLYDLLLFKLFQSNFNWVLRVKFHHWIGRYVEYSRALRFLSPERGDRILDIGSGSGYLFMPFWLISRGYTVYATDITGVELGPFEDLPVVRANRDRLVCERQDARRMSYGDATFGRIICISALEHEEDDASVMREIGRVLKEGGTAVVSVPINKTFQEMRDNSVWSLIRLYDDEALERRLVIPSGLRLRTKELWKIEGRYDQSWETGMDYMNLNALKSIFRYRMVRSTAAIDNAERKRSYGFDIAILALEKAPPHETAAPAGAGGGAGPVIAPPPEGERSR